MRRGRSAACPRPLPPLAAANQSEAEFVEGPGGAWAVPCYCRHTSISVCECRIVVGAPSVSLCSSAPSWIRLDCSLRLQNEGKFTYQWFQYCWGNVITFGAFCWLKWFGILWCFDHIKVILGAIDALCSVQIKKTVCDWHCSSICDSPSFTKTSKTKIDLSFV
jgi:hypothetical protein